MTLITLAASLVPYCFALPPHNYYLTIWLWIVILWFHCITLNWHKQYYSRLRTIFSIASNFPSNHLPTSIDPITLLFAYCLLAFFATILMSLSSSLTIIRSFLFLKDAFPRFTSSLFGWRALHGLQLSCCIR